MCKAESTVFFRCLASALDGPEGVEDRRGLKILRRSAPEGHEKRVVVKCAVKLDPLFQAAFLPLSLPPCRGLGGLAEMPTLVSEHYHAVGGRFVQESGDHFQIVDPEKAVVLVQKGVGGVRLANGISFRWCNGRRGTIVEVLGWVFEREERVGGFGTARWERHVKACEVVAQEWE